MPELAQIAALLHERREPLGGGVGRAVIDVDDLISPAAIERGRDLGNQRRDIVGLVAHGHNDGNGHRSLVGRSQIGAHILGWSGPRAEPALIRRLRRPLIMGRMRPGQPF